MKVLFVIEAEVNPIHGGTARITHTISREMMKRGIECHLAYYTPSLLKPASEFDGKLQLTREYEREAIRGYVKSHGINCIINNLVHIEYKTTAMPAIWAATRGTGCKVINCFHAMPGEELEGNGPVNAIWRWKHGKTDRNTAVKDILLKLCPRRLTISLFGRKVRNRYALLTDYADKVVLLSDKFIPDFTALAGIQDRGQFASVPNALSYPEFIDEADISGKEKEVLILSRINERAKRISLTLKVWKRLQKMGKGPSQGWRLTIVGDGPDLEYYKKMAAKMRLRNVFFEGKQPDGLKYYRRASIFLLTSAYEGWGITLMEAQQNGTVPIAFRSYASLPEIITDGENGISIRNNDLSAFTKALAGLMENKSVRERMARNGLESCRRYTTELVTDRWIKLIESL